MADCESCKNYDRPTICTTCENGSDFEMIVQTNADRIRSMTDEELEEFLEEIKKGEVLELCADFKDGCWYSCKLHHACDEETSKLYLQWLQSKAE